MSPSALHGQSNLWEVPQRLVPRQRATAPTPAPARAGSPPAHHRQQQLNELLLLTSPSGSTAGGCLLREKHYRLRRVGLRQPPDLAHQNSRRCLQLNVNRKEES